jgi:hypothetical protein
VTDTERDKLEAENRILRGMVQTNPVMCEDEGRVVYGLQAKIAELQRRFDLMQADRKFVIGQLRQSLAVAKARELTTERFSADAIRAAEDAVLERIRKLAEQFIKDYGCGYDVLALDSWEQFVAAMREGGGDGEA